MLIEAIVSVPRAETPQQGESVAELPGLRRHVMDAEVRVNDMQVHLNQLREEQRFGMATDRLRFNQPIADAEHNLMVGRVDLDATLAKIKRLETAQQTSSTVPPPPDPLIGQSQLEKMGLGVFLLMLPLMLALARRIWTRSGPRMQVARDPESVASLARIEEAMETIAVEVERIGEAQRFTTKVLSERQPDAARVAPPAAPIVRREPGTITPH